MSNRDFESVFRGIEQRIARMAERAGLSAKHYRDGRCDCNQCAIVRQFVGHMNAMGLPILDRPLTDDAVEDGLVLCESVMIAAVWGIVYLSMDTDSGVSGPFVEGAAPLAFTKAFERVELYLNVIANDNRAQMRAQQIETLRRLFGSE